MQVDGADINENVGIAADWNTLTSLRLNQIKYMVLRKSDDECFGKKVRERTDSVT